jgi:hypothetical protein
MIELQAAQDSEKPQRFPASFMRKKTTGTTLSQIFPAAADSCTGFRSIGLVTWYAALHHFPVRIGTALGSQ